MSEEELVTRGSLRKEADEFRLYGLREVDLMEDCHLTYTNDDDGVWLMCNICKWELCLGYTPALLDAARHWLEHKRLNHDDRDMYHRGRHA